VSKAEQELLDRERQIEEILDECSCADPGTYELLPSNEDQARAIQAGEEDTSPDRFSVIDNRPGILSRLAYDASEDEYRLVLAVEGLTAEQVDAILAVVNVMDAGTVL
jgi:hypothetical protein